LLFDDYTTTDDHGMLITGIYTDQNGTKYYKVKNSWDVNNPYDGYLYASRAFVLYKTTDIMIHKSALPKDIAKKLNF
jgi:bleomycin hydrolase